MLRFLKRTARRVLNRLRRLVGVQRSDWGKEAPDSYYDDVFDNKPSFQVPFYKSSYYPTWLLIADRLRRTGCNSILDVGCGPGQFAALIEDCGFPAYTGIDFSHVAIEKAKTHAPRYDFRVGDVRSKSSYEGLEFDAVICMEVLEHIEDDFAVLSCLPPGVRCLMTVPNFPWRSHVRHFESEESVIARYGEFFRDLSVTRIKGTRSDEEQFYLLDGIRNTVVHSMTEAPAVS